MRVHVGKADLVPDLVRYFEQQSDCVVKQVGKTEIEVSLLGSYRNDRHEAAIERLLGDFSLDNVDPLGPHTANGHG